MTQKSIICPGSSSLLSCVACVKKVPSHWKKKSHTHTCAEPIRAFGILIPSKWFIQSPPPFPTPSHWVSISLELMQAVRRRRRRGGGDCCAGASSASREQIKNSPLLFESKSETHPSTQRGRRAGATVRRYSSATRSGGGGWQLSSLASYIVDSKSFNGKFGRSLNRVELY